jgi:Cys-rich protein (TIGR01571 family)
MWPLYVETDRHYRILTPVFLAGCWATWCPCVVYSKNKQRLEHLRNRGTPLPGGGERLTDNTYIHGALTACGGHGWVLQVCSDGVPVTRYRSHPCTQISNRSDIRTRYSIRGDAIGDCFASCLCNPCALTQERREIELEEESLS